MTQHLKIAVQASLKAGDEILKIYNGKHAVEYKADNSPLTEADKNANHFINEYLTQTSIPIISEENKQIPYAERKKWNVCWIVDPLDGTKEFIKRNGEFTVNITLIENQKPILGVIYVPVTKELYFGVVDEQKACKVIIGSNENISSLIENAKRISPAKKIAGKIRIAGSRSHMNEDTFNFIEGLKKDYGEIEMISKGSSLKFCLIAEGKADVYPRFAPTMEWDTAAGHAICEASGLQVISRETGNALLYNKENLLNPSFLVSKKMYQKENMKNK